MIPWRISVYDATLGTLTLPSGPSRFVYVHDGAAVLTDEAGTKALAAGEGQFCLGTAKLTGHGTVWIYEAGPDGPLLAGPGVSPVLSRLIGIAAPCQRLLRADRIESTAGSVTPRHFHRGPGIRRLLYGRILGEIGTGFERIDPGNAWFESGTDPVIGSNIHDGNSAFVRVMVLPPELQGGITSFVATDAIEAQKPRAVQNQVFAEIMVNA
jgi:hypothetical protein